MVEVLGRLTRRCRKSRKQNYVGSGTHPTPLQGPSCCNNRMIPLPYSDSEKHGRQRKKPGLP
eukprot:1151365-Pelagomonas_calceolata.AAC.12